MSYVSIIFHLNYRIKILHNILPIIEKNTIPNPTTPKLTTLYTFNNKEKINPPIGMNITATVNIILKTLPK